MKVEINYSELAFILKIPVKQSREFFKKELEMDKITFKDTISSNKLHGKFGIINSVDPRYDGECKFDFYLNQCAKSFKHFVNEKSFVKAKKFTGGKSVFYKILSKEVLNTLQKNVEEKHLAVYGKNKHDQKI